MSYSIQAALAAPTYILDIETRQGVTQYGYHLGTDPRVAEQIALEQLKRDGVLSVALRLDKKLVAIYDWRDI
jgi:hypothetical protein